MDEAKPVRCGCGGKARHVYHAGHSRMRCDDCGISTIDYDTEAEAIEAWNQAMNAPEKGKWIKKSVSYVKGQIEELHSAKCSVCGKYYTTPYLNYFDSYKFCPHCGAEMEK